LNTIYINIESIITRKAK